MAVGERFYPLKMASELNPADGLTKMLSGNKFSVSYEQMMNDPIVETSIQDMDRTASQHREDSTVPS